MHKYFYQTRSEHFSIAEFNGVSHVLYGETYIGAFPTPEIAARAVATGERWPADKERPRCALEVPVYLAHWDSLWVKLNRLPDFPPIDPESKQQRTEQLNRTRSVVADDERGQTV